MAKIKMPPLPVGMADNATLKGLIEASKNPIFSGAVKERVDAMREQMERTLKKQGGGHGR